MGRTIAIIGNVASGKTSLALALKKDFGLIDGIEDLTQRPFQTAFMQDHTCCGFQNQMDFLLYRAAQEARIRAAAQDGVQDGGLEMDYHVFSHLFAQLGYLSPAELALCGRFYHLVRQNLPRPDYVIWLDVHPAVAAERFRRRARPIDIVQPEHTEVIHRLLLRLIDDLRARRIPLFRVDVNAHDPQLARTLDAVRPQVQRWLKETK